MTRVETHAKAAPASRLRTRPPTPAVRRGKAPSTRREPKGATREVTAASLFEGARPQSIHGPHIKELETVRGYATVDLGTIDKVNILMREACRAHAIMVISGPVGVGKSFAAGRGADACATDASRPADVVWVELSTSARGRALLQELYPQITGGLVPAPNTTLQQLRFQLAEALSEGHRLLVVDEAQHVGREAMLVLRWLMDQPATQAALVLVGTPELWNSLAPEMRSRASYDVCLKPVADDEISSVLFAYHPLFCDLESDHLRFLNRVYARGRIRWWAHFLARAFHYAETRGGLDKELADLVVASMPKGA